VESISTLVGLAAIAQLGERKTEDLKVTGSIPVGGKLLVFVLELRAPESPATKAKGNSLHHTNSASVYYVYFIF